MTKNYFKNIYQKIKENNQQDAQNKNNERDIQNGNNQGNTQNQRLNEKELLIIPQS